MGLVIGDVGGVAVRSSWGRTTCSYVEGTITTGLVA